jgi:hypothetical protein
VSRARRRPLLAAPLAGRIRILRKHWADPNERPMDPTDGCGQLGVLDYR